MKGRGACSASGPPGPVRCCCSSTPGTAPHFGITPAEVRAFLREVGYTIYLLDGA